MLESWRTARNIGETESAFSHLDQLEGGLGNLHLLGILLVRDRSVQECKTTEEAYKMENIVVIFGMSGVQQN